MSATIALSAPSEVVTHVDKRWLGCLVVVAAPGPSLTRGIADRCQGHLAIAVQDAYRLMPWADVLYGCDARWWEVHDGCPSFVGEKWSSHGEDTDDKSAVASRFGLKLVAGKTEVGFHHAGPRVHYGRSSGFQAINLAILFGAGRIVLVGFDMAIRGGRRHFFGDHPKPLHNTDNYAQFIPHFDRAAKALPPGVEIVNATPGSALKCFPMMTLENALGL